MKFPSLKTVIKGVLGTYFGVGAVGLIYEGAQDLGWAPSRSYSRDYDHKGLATITLNEHRTGFIFAAARTTTYHLRNGIVCQEISALGLVNGFEPLGQIKEKSCKTFSMAVAGELGFMARRAGYDSEFVTKALADDGVMREAIISANYPYVVVPESRKHQP